ncbi:MAG: hypothetical protein K2K44_13150, partial [Oscillospiraceae bacterium]|nr:hypothetical protein [Oscillospiraceae bacterium]
MKKFKLVGVLLSAVMLAACSGNAAEQEVTETGSESSVTTAATASETATMSETEVEVSETAFKLFFEPAKECVQVSRNNKFIDFEFIEDYQGTTDIGDLADKAVEFLMTTEEYADAMSKIDEIDVEFGEPYIKDGKIVPQLEAAYPADYDGDGSTETFITLKMPMRDKFSLLYSFFIFADSKGNMTLLDYNCGIYDTVFLDYGKFKQITFGGTGRIGAEDITFLYGVVNGEVKILYLGRVSFFKEDCFLSTHGHMSSGEFMYYDTAAQEYRSIIGVQMTVDEIKEMDKDGVLAEYYENDEYGERVYGLVGGKYYCVNFGEYETEAVYTYDGKFELAENSKVRYKLENNSLENAVVDIDIEQALANMKPPEEPFVTVSPDNEFIDFEIIEDYQGTTDIGELADKAVEFLKESEYYAKSMENISEFTDGEFSEYIRDSVIVPKFSIAYPNDYDGDGNTETFIIIKMPYSPPNLRDGLVTIRDFVIFSDKDGNMEIIDETSNVFPVQFLNYGKFKHIAIGGAGMAGVEEHTILYGVKDGRFVRYYGDRCYFAKEDCFLSVFGWQGRRDFMYFDTAAQEYRVIVGVDVSVEDIRAMDTTNVLAEFLEYDGKLYIKLIGGKYYCIVQGYMDWGHVYT